MRPPETWADLPFFHDDLPRIEAALAAETRQILPPAPQVFAALDACPPKDVRVVILGQDPYPTPGHAHGLAFSAEPEVRPLPRSLGNIYKELEAEFGAVPPNGDLRFWARQGVLLLLSICEYRAALEKACASCGGGRRGPAGGGGGSKLANDGEAAR